MTHFANYRELISGQRRGVLAGLSRAALWLLSGGYGLGVCVRNLMFDVGWRRVSRAPVPVISLGNLTTGGTGKTPLAAYLARWFRSRSLRVAFLSRGYKAAPGEMNDEALVLEQLCPDVPHLQGADRVSLAQVACEELASQLLILDDGFQHRRLYRDLDIVVIDALAPWGFGALLPRGLLREPVSGLRRAALVMLTRVDLVPSAEITRLRTQIGRVIPMCPIVETAFVSSELVSSTGARLDAARLSGERIAAFAGIGNPGGFRQTLETLAGPLAGFREYADHHPYSRDDIESLREFAESSGATLLITTLKDLVKIGVDRLGTVPLWALSQETRILGGGDQLDAVLEAVSALVPVDADDEC